MNPRRYTQLSEDYILLVSGLLATSVALRFSKGMRKISISDVAKDFLFSIAGSLVANLVIYGVRIWVSIFDFGNLLHIVLLWGVVLSILNWRPIRSLFE